ncbi:BTAD domain-containing putative transcriptional regulator [Pseudonocardia acidicola]|uniref:Transcriptional activator domain protein n=1 Tax=Pseudonocardia acidicola TaxID=2724939 RepID=A0ABX1S980_9PSEU|nr:BTAD domain-containing putative transcriptional regulator [Pseudonocardia acidicola]NMH96814.1 transcriptional activator domain protein [Pseudonocardia acidicola]
MRVIQLKISPPPVGGTVVRRPRIESLLSRLIEQHRVVCVLASAGAGKTTAVLQAAHQLRRPLSWLGVDATDAVTGRLLTYLEAAIARQVSGVEGMASAALAAQLPHAEVAGLLAEAVGDSNLLIVLDDAERIADQPDALAVVASFARYLPPTARLVIISRSVLPFDAAGGASFLTYVAAVGEEDLAFTVQEAADALALSGRPDVDPAEAIVETGGWVTGVLFEAWRSADHVIGIGGEADPLHGYLSTQILGQLDPAEREFLISTALLKEVTPAAAESLGLPDAATRLHCLRARRLPVAWDRDGRAMRCHPRFREYLLELLNRRSDADVRALHLAYARLLVELQHDEEAVEEFFGAGALDAALEVVERIIVGIIERTDFALAERWLQRLASARSADRLTLVIAELMLAVAREDYGRGANLADELAAAGRRDELAGISGRAAGLMAWCYLHTGRVADIRAVLNSGRPGDELDAMHYAMRVVEDVPPPLGPAAGSLTGGPFDALVMRTHYDLGRLSLLADPPSSPWAAKAGDPWRAGALLATGHTEQGFELYQGLEGTHEQGVWLSAVIGPKLMAELGERDTAWRLLGAGRERIVASGSELFRMLSLLTEAELLLRFDTDAAAARRVLEEVASHPVGLEYANIREHTNTLLGCALLMDGEDLRARDCLAAAVASMRAGERILWLSAAAVYLAEARWRLGEEQAADDAANLALWAAEQQGSNHSLLQALAEFPAVLSRRLDSEPHADSPWHELGRALMVLGVELGDVLAATVHVTEFGRTAVLVNGEDAALRLKKSYELLAFLANSGRDEVARQELLEVLFEGRSDDAAGSYLRQAMLRLRRAVPEVLHAGGVAGRVGLGPGVRVTTESERLSALLRQAASMRGHDRLQMLLRALEIADRGEYLPGVQSRWAEERRRHLSSMVQEARYDAAEIAFATGHFRQAARLVRDVLRADPFREAAWRLEMRIADASGNQDRVIAAYRACERALSELGTQPAPTTVQLLQDLRR